MVVQSSSSIRGMIKALAEGHVAEEVQFKREKAEGSVEAATPPKSKAAHL